MKRFFFPKSGLFLFSLFVLFSCGQISKKTKDPSKDSVSQLTDTLTVAERLQVYLTNTDENYSSFKVYPESNIELPYISPFSTLALDSVRAYGPAILKAKRTPELSDFNLIALRYHSEHQALRAFIQLIELTGGRKNHSKIDKRALRLLEVDKGVFIIRHQRLVISLIRDCEDKHKDPDDWNAVVDDFIKKMEIDYIGLPYLYCDCGDSLLTLNKMRREIH